MSGPAATGSAHWHSVSRSWDLIGEPLRPTREDQAGYYRLAQDWMGRYGTPRVLLLGVTPEIYRLPWPEGQDFLAIDHSSAMIEHVWPGPRKNVVEASWLDLPFPTGSRDLVFCDGGFNLLDYPVSQRRLIDRLHDVVTGGGRCIFRFFSLPRLKESPEVVLSDLLLGRIENINILKLRMGMALQESAETGVEMGKIWHKLRGSMIDWESLAVRIGWPLGHLLSIDTCRDAEERFHFLSVDQTKELFCQEGKFVCLGHHHPDYSLGECCPLIVFERR